MENKKPQSVDPRRTERVYELDLLRFFAAFLVLLFHYTYRGMDPVALTDVYFPYLNQVFRYGDLGVDVFFLISGYVVLMSAMRQDLCSFVASRISRLYPSYWICLTLTALTIVCLGDGLFPVSLDQYLAHLTMIHRYLGYENIDEVYHTLLVELRFYTLLGLLILTNSLRYIMPFLWIWLTLTLLVLAGYFFRGLGFFVIPSWSHYFIAGGAFYLLSQRKGVNNWHLYLLLLLCYGLVVFQMQIRFTEKLGVDHAWIASGLMLPVFLLFHLIATGRLRRFARPWFVSLGALTYPLYLFHSVIGMILLSLFSDLNRFVLLVAITCFSLASAWLINHCAEKPYTPAFRQLLTRWFEPMPQLLHRKHSAFPE